MKRIGSIFRSIEDWIAGSLLVGGLGIMLYQVFLRYVLNYPTTWQDEISRYLVVWGALIGSAIAIRDNEHIKVDVLYQFFSKRIKWLTDLFANLITLIFFTFMIFYGSILVKEKFVSGQSSYSGFSLWVIYLSLPLSGIFMFIQTIINIFNLKYKEENCIEQE